MSKLQSYLGVKSNPAGKTLPMNSMLAGPNGTPSNLSEALDHISEHLKLGWSASERTIARMHLKDFMAQKFGVAMFSNPEAEDLLKKLFTTLFD
jgi:hypothetical protein